MLMCILVKFVMPILVSSSVNWDLKDFNNLFRDHFTSEER